MLQVIRVPVFCASVVCTSGCVIGYNSMLFVTRTNAGVDVSSEPPTAEVSIGRLEGLFAPTYEGGKTPPVLASFRFDTDLFSTFIGSAFACGDAAVTMATLYGEDDYVKPNLRGHEYWEHLECAPPGVEPEAGTGAFCSALELSRKPEFPWFVRKLNPHRVRPVLFGTDTSLGLKVAWSGLTAQMPDTLRLAYQRKELALAPVSLQPTGDDAEGPHRAQAPSLLATVDTGATVRGMKDTGLQYLQYFASGRAATALAVRQGVRKAMLTRLDPNRDKVATGVTYEAEFTSDRLRDAIKAWVLEDPATRVPEFEGWLREEGVRLSFSTWIDDSRTKETDLLRAAGRFGIQVD